MRKTLIVGILLLTATIALIPEASANHGCKHVVAAAASKLPAGDTDTWGVKPGRYSIHAGTAFFAPVSCGGTVACTNPADNIWDCTVTSGDGGFAFQNSGENDAAYSFAKVV